MGGILFIISFNIDDNSYLKFKEKHVEIEKNTFFMITQNNIGIF